MVRTHFTVSIFVAKYLFENNTSSRVGTSDLAGGIGYCGVVCQLPESEMHNGAHSSLKIRNLSSIFH